MVASGMTRSRVDMADDEYTVGRLSLHLSLFMQRWLDQQSYLLLTRVYSEHGEIHRER